VDVASAAVLVADVVAVDCDDIRLEVVPPVLDEFERDIEEVVVPVFDEIERDAEDVVVVVASLTGLVGSAVPS